MWPEGTVTVVSTYQPKIFATNCLLLCLTVNETNPIKSLLHLSLSDPEKAERELEAAGLRE